MSQLTTPPAPQNIIIVRRLHPEDDGHHGGAWKIAFADFMTAMMAFFLVMWLTSVSDEAKKKAIAQYFNPIQLNSSSPDASGLDSGDAPATSKPPPPALGEVKDGGSAESKPLSGVATGGEEQALFRDPYAVLAEIAAEGGPGTRVDGVQGVPDGSGLPGLNGGEAYRDPFDPSSWQLEPNTVASAPGRKQEPAEFATKTEVAAPPAAPKPDAAKAAAATPAVPGQLSAAAQSLNQEIQRQVQATDPKAASGVQVSEGEGGITISLADNVTSGMFEIGSAKPRAETIRMMEGIAKILSERKGDIAIRGYTDARPYAGQEYDNWRLSTSRAHMAYYMLSRGGLAEDRIDSIEGYGDRKLKDPKDPFGAVNRRIEIVLKEPAQ